MWWSLAAWLLAWFLLLALIERLRPRRPAGEWRARIPANLSLGLLNTLMLRFAVPVSAVGAALWAAQQPFGLWHWMGLSGPVEIVVSFVLLDFAVYVQHVLSHRLRWFWRLHRVHHLDLEFDVSTSIRFHPLEILVSLVYKCGIVILLGASAASVLALEFLLAAGAMFNHANLALPATLDAALRKLVVTPDMHRVHHSTRRAEHDRNFGFFLSWWDRCFGTYVDQPADGHAGMRIGLPEQRDPRFTGRFARLLTTPFQ